ncbi:MAG: sigma-70 family RNA polymerase sigma factor [Gemmataceae bacterium]
MPEQWNNLVNRIRGLLDGPTGPEPCDADLLERFLARREEAAFAALIERHGPMVLGVCRRILHGSADAEDAFQVTFLTLALRARGLRNRQALASWLYQVAYFVSLRARRRSTRRREQEVQGMIPVASDPARNVESEELGTLLDDELSKLPEKYRAPLVLCGLQGKTSEEAARELGWPLGSMSRRLSRGRELLRQRLLKLGYTVPAAAAAAFWPQPASAAVPPALAERTIQNGLLLLAGQSVAPLGGGVAPLLQETLRSMMVSKARLAIGLVFVLVCIGTAASFALGVFQSPPPPPPVVLRVEADDQRGPPEVELPEGAVARFGSLDWRHGGDVKFAGFVNDGKQIVTVTSSESHGEGRYHGFCRLWDPATGRALRRFPMRDDVAQACLSRDGRRLAVIGHNRGELCVYEVDSSKLLCVIPGTPKGGAFDGFAGMCFAPDGKRLATISSDQVVRTWNAATGKLLLELGEPGDRPGIEWPNALTFSPDGKTLAYSTSALKAEGWTGSVCFWDAATGKLCHTVEETSDNPLNLTHLDGIEYAPDGKSYVRPRKDGTVSLCAADTGKEIRRLGQPRQRRPQQPTQLARMLFAPDGKTIAVRDHDYGLRLRLYEVATGKEIRLLGDDRATGRLDPNDSLNFSADSRQLVAVSCNTIRLWDVASGKETTTSAGHQSQLQHLNVSADGKTMITHGDDQAILVWDLVTGQEKKRYDLPYFIRNLAVSDDGRLLAFGGPGEVIHVWEAATGKVRHTLEVQGKAQAQRRGGEGGLAFSPDASLLASKDGGFVQADGTAPAIRLWDLNTGKQLRQFSDPRVHMGFHDLQFTADGRLLAVMSMRPEKNQSEMKHCGVRFFDVASGRFVREINPERGFLNHFYLSPDGRSVAMRLSEDKVVSIWEVATGGQRSSLEGTSPWHLAFTRDGKALAAADMQNRLCFWDLRTGKLVARQHSPVQMRALAFLPDGRLASANSDTTALLWDASLYLDQLPAPGGKLDEENLHQLWQELLDRDASVAGRAQARLQSAPTQSLALFEKRLEPAQPIDARRVDKLIADLDSDDFAVRRAALDELGDLGMAIEARLRRALAGSPSLEATNRLRELLDSLPARPLPAATLRHIRSVEVLETFRARPLLEKLARGAPEARLTQEAQASLARLKP